MDPKTGLVCDPTKLDLILPHTVSMQAHHLHLSRVQLGRHGRRDGELDLPPGIPVCLSLHQLRLGGQQRVHGTQPVTTTAARTDVQLKVQTKSSQIRINYLCKQHDSEI